MGRPRNDDRLSSLASAPQSSDITFRCECATEHTVCGSTYSSGMCMLYANPVVVPRSRASRSPKSVPVVRSAAPHSHTSGLSMPPAFQSCLRAQTRSRRVVLARPCQRLVAEA
eukprot:180383-Prymnesium_polylepis.1